MTLLQKKITTDRITNLSKLQYFAYTLHLTTHTENNNSINSDSRKIRLGRRVSKWECQVRKIPVIRIIDVNVAEWHVIKHPVVSVGSDVLGARLRRVVIRALDYKSEMLHGPLLRHTVVTDVHCQTVRLEAECWPLEAATPCNQASFVSWPQIQVCVQLPTQGRRKYKIQPLCSCPGHPQKTVTKVIT